MPAASVNRTTTFVVVPVQPARMLSGSMSSLNVYVIESPSSIVPTVAPPLAVWMSVAVGTVLSTVTVKPVCVRTLALLSVEVSE